jgi:hypothetical protein
LLGLGSFHVLEEGGQVGLALLDAFDGQWGASIGFGILEVETDTLAI